MKKNKDKDNHDFKADMQTIKNEDIRNLQNTFSQFFGSKPQEIKKYSSKLKKQVYLFGLVISISAIGILFLTQKVNFVEF